MLARRKAEGDGEQQEDKTVERSVHTEVSQLATEAIRNLVARNEGRMADVLGERGDAEEQSCTAAASEPS